METLKCEPLSGLGNARWRHSLFRSQAWGGEECGSRLTSGSVVPVPLLTAHAAPEDTARTRSSEEHYCPHANWEQTENYSL